MIYTVTNSVLANNTNLLCFFVFFLLSELCFLITADIPTVEPAIPTEIEIKEAKAEMETDPVIIEAKISKCSI